jgi:hypothetical protein
MTPADVNSRYEVTGITSQAVGYNVNGTRFISRPEYLQLSVLFLIVLVSPSGQVTG